MCKYLFISLQHATIFWRAVRPTLPRLRRGPSQMQGLAEARRAKAGCHRQWLCGADGAAPSNFGCALKAAGQKIQHIF
jgi:hypothetical protein